MPDPEPPPGTELDLAARRKELARALSGLGDRDRDMMLALFSDAPPSYTELAAMLDMPVGSIGPIRGRCLAKLRLDGGLQRLVEELD